jgi:hypothetical protein
MIRQSSVTATPPFARSAAKSSLPGQSTAPIPWPIGKRPGGRARALVVFAGLANAVRRELAAAVCHFWGVTGQTVSKWRKAIGVGQYTEGTTRLKSASATASEGIARALELAHAKSGDLERRRKISEAKKAGRRDGEAGVLHVVGVG